MCLVGAATNRRLSEIMTATERLTLLFIEGAVVKAIGSTAEAWHRTLLLSFHGASRQTSPRRAITTATANSILLFRGTMVTARPSFGRDLQTVRCHTRSSLVIRRMLLSRVITTVMRNAISQPHEM